MVSRGRAAETAERSPRRLIHEALIDLCLDSGFGEVTVDGLCERAGVARATFEREFGTLSACQYETLTVELRRFHERLDPLRNGPGPWRDRVRATAYELGRLFAEDERAARFMVFGMRTGNEDALLLFEDELGAMVTLIDEGRMEMDDPDELDRSTAEQITGGFFNHLFQTLAGGSLPDEAEVVPELMYMAVLPYCGEAAARLELEIPPPPRSKRDSGLNQA